MTRGPAPYDPQPGNPIPNPVPPDNNPVEVPTNDPNEIPAIDPGRSPAAPPFQPQPNPAPPDTPGPVGRVTGKRRS